MADVAGELSRLELFGDLGSAALTRLGARTLPRRLGRGQLLFAQGEPSGHLFVVRSGRLRVFVSSQHGDDLVLAVLEPGDSFGEVSVLTGEARSASVDALEPSELLAVPAEDVRQVLLDDPQALLALTGRLAGIVRRVTDAAADLVFLDVPRRLAKLLVTEAAPQPDGSLVCDLNMSQSAVAARLGATRQSLNRALGEFARRSWIALDGTTVRLHDPGALRRFAGS
jgi:CRP-like cAMP-binding protein